MKKRKAMIREIVMDILSGREKVELDPWQFNHLTRGVLEVMVRRNIQQVEERMPLSAYPTLAPEDEDIIREVFWDLFIEKVITLGCNADNPLFPWFKIHSEFKGISL